MIKVSYRGGTLKVPSDREEYNPIREEELRRQLATERSWRSASAEIYEQQLVKFHAGEKDRSVFVPYDEVGAWPGGLYSQYKLSDEEVTKRILAEFLRNLVQEEGQKLDPKSFWQVAPPEWGYLQSNLSSPTAKRGVDWLSVGYLEGRGGSSSSWSLYFAYSEGFWQRIKPLLEQEGFQVEL